MSEASANKKIILSLLLLLLSAAVLIDRLSWQPNPASTTTVIALLTFIIIGLPHFDWRERYLLGGATLISITVAFFASEPTTVFSKAISQSCFLAAFMVLLSLLREAAVSSQSVLRLGSYLTRQPSGRRYVAIAGGGHLISIVLNFGALSLLGPLIQRGVRSNSTDPQQLALSERRQLSALARGFSWFVTWSPTSITQALIPAIVIGCNPTLVMLLGIVILLPVMLAGWLEDRWRFKHSNQSGEHSGAPLPTSAALRFGLVCLSLAAISMLLAHTRNVTLVTALMCCAPLVTAIWIVVQHLRGRGGLASAFTRLKAVAMHSPANGAPEAIAIACSGYIGISAAGALADKNIAIIDQIAGLPPLMLYLGSALLIPVLASVGIHPIMIVSFAGSLLSESPALLANPTLLAVSFICGWAINLTSSPFSATNLIMSRTTGVSGVTLAWRWNMRFSLLAYIICTLCLALFAAMLAA